MSLKRVIIVGIILLLATSVATVAAQSAQGDTYSETYVSFGTSDNAVTNYSVDGEVLFESAEIEARSNAESRGAAGLGVGLSGGLDLSSITDIRGAAVMNSMKARTSVNVEFDGSASMEMHDNPNGVIVVRSGGEEQLVEVEVPANARAEVKSDVIVSIEKNGVNGSLIVVGNGDAEINEEGNVVAHLGNNANAVFRADSDTSTGDEERKNQLISEGHVAAEAQFMDEGETEIDAATYLPDTDAEGRHTTENQVEVTVDRTESDGKIVMITVSREVIGSTENFNVTIDGESAVEVSSYSELERSLDNRESGYMVRGDTATQASAGVLVAIDGFSERTVELTSTDDGTGDGSDDGTNDGDGDMDNGDSDTGGSEGLPGFTTVLAALGIMSAIFIGRRK